MIKIGFCKYISIFLLVLLVPRLYSETNTKLPLNLTFAGDLMSHSENFTMKDFSLAYADVKTFLKNDDISFVNLETPVCDSLPYSAYPLFNSKSFYVDCAIDAGFDVFSLANNHSNDQGFAGMISTLKYFTRKRAFEIYSAGIKNEKENNISYDIIECKDWKILFASITEILNTRTANKALDYFSPNQKDKLKDELIFLRQKHQCDLFVLSIHANEPEYVLTVTEKRKKWYYELLDCGVDILFANHQHVPQEWEIVKDAKTQKDKLIMYCLGNFVSGQRRKPNYNKPDGIQEYKGDSYLLQVTVNNPQTIERVLPVYITTHIDTTKKDERNFVVRHFTESFISEIEKINKVQAAYYKRRLELLYKIKGKTTWR